MSSVYIPSSIAVAPKLEKLLFNEFLDSSGLRNGSASGRMYPVVDVHESVDNFKVNADMPGLLPKDVEVTLDNGYLVIAGERQKSSDDTTVNSLQTEVVYGAFCRKVKLPQSADAEQVTAELKNGVLSITVGKKSEAKPRKIEVT